MNGVSVQHSEHFAIIMFDLSKQDYRQIVDWIGEYRGDVVNFCDKISQLKTEISGQLSVQLMIECFKNSHILPEKCQQILNGLAG